MNVKKVGFCLSGGGAIPGNFEVGALETVIQAGIMPNYIIGVSVGAIIAAKTAEILAKHGAEKINLLSEVWIRRVTGPNSIYNTSNFKLLSKSSLFDNTPLIKMINEELDMEAIMASDIKVEVVVVDNDGELALFSNKSHTADVFKQAIIASAAIPIQFPPVMIEDKVYVDGGILKPVDISPAIHNLCDSLFIFLVKPLKNEISIEPKQFLTMPWWKKRRFAWLQALHAKDSIDVIVERFLITNDNIKKYMELEEDLKSKLIPALELNEEKSGLTKKIIEESFKAGGFKFQKRHYVESVIFAPKIVLPGNMYNFTSADIVEGIRYGRDYASRELKRLGITG